MSERAPQHESRNTEPSAERIPESHEQAEKPVESKKHTKESISALRQEVAHNAEPKAETASKHTEKSQKPRYSYLDRKIKDQKFDETMAITRKRLSKPEAAFSKFIHRPAVEKVSETVGQTVGRPSAIMGGGFFAAFGLIAISWYAKHNGFSLSGFEFILLVIGGMLVGVILEFVSRFIRASFK